MDLVELKSLIEEEEGEHLEFKELPSGSISLLGNGGEQRRSVLGYCVALGNEGGGKLVLGVSDKKPRSITGVSAFDSFEDVKKQIYGSIGLRLHIEEVLDGSKRVVVITVPGRPKAQTLKFYGKPLMRVGEELRDMDDATLKKILNECEPDWSAQICERAVLEDLDQLAIVTARENFKKKNLRLPEEVGTWSDETFLDKAKLSIKGEITNAAILLLGKPESSSLILPAVAQITWILKGEDGQEKDYEHFSPPFLLSVDFVFQRIRNLKYRYIKDGSLFPEEVDMYDSRVIREALHNCIAHQDYSLHGRVQVVESESGYLFLSNEGGFLPGSVEAVIQTDSPQQYYRNKLLVDAMVNLNMIDTIGSGIKKMFTLQKQRYFPLPSYDLSNDKVVVKIYGKVLDLNYARALAQHKDLTLVEIMLLDQIQKRKTISKQNAKYLKEKNLIEGRYPNLYISHVIAKTTGSLAQYVKNRPFQDQHYKDILLEFLKRNPGSSRGEIDSLLIPTLSDILTDQQKKNKVTNLVYNLSKKEKKIKNLGNNRAPKWELNI